MRWPGALLAFLVQLVFMSLYAVFSYAAGAPLPALSAVVLTLTAVYAATVFLWLKRGLCLWVFTALFVLGAAGAAVRHFETIFRGGQLDVAAVAVLTGDLIFVYAVTYLCRRYVS